MLQLSHCDKSRGSSTARVCVYVCAWRGHRARIASRKSCLRLPFLRDSIPDANFGRRRCSGISFSTREDFVLCIQDRVDRQRQLRRQQITCHDTFSYRNPIACYKKKKKGRVTRDVVAHVQSEMHHLIRADSQTSLPLSHLTRFMIGTDKLNKRASGG